MNNQVKSILSSVAEKTLGDLAFVFSMPAEEEQVRDVMKAAVVEFSGPFSGDFMAAVTVENLPAIAANMLGLEEEGGAPPTQVQQDDALKELTNVVCGNLLPAIAGTEVVFNIQAPVVIADEDFRKRSGQGEMVAHVHLTLDEGEAEFLFFVSGGEAAMENCIESGIGVGETEGD